MRILQAKLKLALKYLLQVWGANGVRQFLSKVLSMKIQHRTFGYDDTSRFLLVWLPIFDFRLVSIFIHLSVSGTMRIVQIFCLSFFFNDHHFRPICSQGDEFKKLKDRLGCSELNNSCSMLHTDALLQFDSIVHVHRGPVAL